MIRKLRPGRARLNVLLLTNSVAMGGTEEHVRLLAEHLDRDHFTVVGVAPADANIADFAASLEARTDAFQLLTPDRRLGGRRAAFETLGLVRAVRRRGVDVAHLHSTTFGGLWRPTLACWAAGVRRVYVTEHLAPYGPVSRWRRLERRLFGHFVTRFIAVSEKNRAERAQRLHTPSERIAVVPNGIDVSRFEAIPESSVEAVRAEYDLARSVVVGAVVRLEPDKGVSDLIEAFAIVAAAHADVRLLIVGDGSARAELEAQVARLGLGSVVSFAGFRSDPRPYLAALDVYVLPVPAGSASIGLLEAMATGLPAIITFGSPGEAVEPGVSGWWAEPRDPVDLARRIDDLVRRPEARRSMGKAAHDRIVADFSAARVAQQLGRLYRTNALEPGTSG